MNKMKKQKKTGGDEFSEGNGSLFDSRLMRISLIMGIIVASMTILVMGPKVFTSNHDKYATIRIEGEVRDKEEQYLIVGARVVIIASDFGNTTGKEGKYTILYKTQKGEREKIKVHASHDYYSSEEKEIIISSEINSHTFYLTRITTHE